MPGRRDRQELRDPLDDPEDYRLPNLHAPTSFLWADTRIVATGLLTSPARIFPGPQPSAVVARCRCRRRRRTPTPPAFLRPPPRTRAAGRPRGPPDRAARCDRGNPAAPPPPPRDAVWPSTDPG